ncbi:phosphopantetheine-containing protein [Saccharomonospora marina XMU15]|uniref:Phosphopantetheine-containing protein n=1 Tax=Saccharomonospora marina XMU15 TaxID=882083 RepID=H5X6Y3_9PSEU|nr:phosphopantetheine-binding protein [Saccharomonospora marina]EHR52413.1 phosphopantetheine-containing protein [Saccharomonospora marina XMU15]
MSDPELREIVVSTYRDVLQVSHLGPDDDFFAEGGDSVKGVALLDRLHERTGVRLPISVLFMKRTAGEIADELAASLAR